MDPSYRFVSGSDGRLVDIRELTPATRYDLGPYGCLGCGDEMVPALGAKMVHHFRQKTDGARNCTRETYLHQAGKRAVRLGFERARAAGQPFFLYREEITLCHARAQVAGFPCRLEETHRHDLTRWFASAVEEVPIKGFIADVLLSDAKGVEHLLVEIEVTHSCEPQKVASGLRIFEVRVQSEEDIAHLSRGLDATRDGVRLHGFGPPREHLRKTCKTCPTDVTLFAVFNSGKCYYGTKPMQAALGMALRRNVLHYEITPGQAGFAFEIVEEMEALVKEARFGPKQVPVKSCFLCLNGKINRNPDEGSIYCFDRRRGLAHTTAADCAAYKPFSTREALETRRAYQEARDEEYAKARFAPKAPPPASFEDGMPVAEWGSFRADGRFGSETPQDEDGVVLEGGHPAGRLMRVAPVPPPEWHARMAAWKARFEAGERQPPDPPPADTEESG